MRQLAAWVLVIGLCGSVPNLADAQGLTSSGAGALNRAMAGASTAAPLDAGGALYWNPAAISGLRQNELLVGDELLYPTIHVTSTTSGALFPGAAGSGTTLSNNGLNSIPAIALVYRPQPDSPWTLGIGIFAFAGGGVNFAGDPNNPILAPKNLPTSFGVGPIYSNMSVLQQSLAVSGQLTDRLAIGFGPTIDYSTVSFDPAFFATPTATGFPAATHSRPFWGAGYQAGLFYRLNDDIDLGFSYKSPQWMETWKFNSKDAAGNALSPEITATLPRIVSWGIGYHGLKRTTIATDLRYMNYRDTSLFGQPLSAGGLGWQDVFAVATGVQFRASQAVSLQAGYLYNTNPIPAPLTLFNVQAPGIIQHTVSFGATYQISSNLSSSLTYIHGFQNAIVGPVAELPGAAVKLDAAYDSLAIALNLRFGGRSR